MSLQRRINARALKQIKDLKAYHQRFDQIDKGQKNGSCNLTACQRPLKDELQHQFIEGNFTGGPRLYYCSKCARDFEDWDYRSGDRVRICREAK